MSTPHQPQTPDQRATGSNPRFWQETGDTTAPAPVGDPAPEHRRNGSRGYGLTALIVAACSIVLGIVTPHFAAILVAGGAIVAAVGMRKCAGGPRKLAVTGLIVSAIVFVLCVIYTIVVYAVMGPSIYQGL
ncbi:hypothetical protein [Microbacterium lacticum]